MVGSVVIKVGKRVCRKNVWVDKVGWFLYLLICNLYISIIINFVIERSTALGIERCDFGKKSKLRCRGFEKNW